MPAVLAAIGSAFVFLVTMLLKFRTVVIRAVLIALGLYFVGVIADKLSGFIGQIADFVLGADTQFVGNSYLSFVNYIAPVSEALNLIVLILSLKIASVVLMIGLWGCKSMWSIATKANGGN